MLPRSSALLRPTRAPLPAGIAVGAAAVALTTLLVYPLAEVVPAVSTGVVYLLAVLLVASYAGLPVGLGTAAASALALNWFHIPPTGRFTMADAQNWIALAVFVVVAAVAATLAEIARARTREAELRRREADLAADLARILLGGSDVRAALPAAAERVAEALGVARTEIELGDARDGIPLRDGETRLGALRLDGEAGDGPVAAERVVPALAAVLGIALQREAVQREAVETAALRRSDDIKTSILRAVSHDLRSPLTAISTAGEALASAQLDAEDRRELAAAVTGEAERLSRLVDKLLDLSRLQGGAADPRREWSSVDEVLRVAIEETPHPPGFNVAIDRDLPLVRADAAQLERAFANLLENAARHGRARPIAVRARVVGRRLLVRIVDRGPGIPGRELERIFEPFHRGESARDDGHVGSGLGLAVVRGFVEANGGRVWAESLPGQGTTFVVELPVEEAAGQGDGEAVGSAAR